MNNIKPLLTACFIFIIGTVHAQFAQTIRGNVIDNVLQTPIASASITLDDVTTTTDSAGTFKFKNIGIGTHILKITHVSYKDYTNTTVENISGKELVLSIPLEAKFKLQEDVVIKSAKLANRPLNDASVTSTRAFTVEETQRYAAAVNDPLRMVTIFTGVVSTDDGNNTISIRGNSPTGLLWRMEGVDIPNPNHFSSQGGTGGGISILSSQLLSNSDFVTGAFAAEYGNALSGVFDLKLRKGNNEQHEYSLQAGVLGLNASAEGPFNKTYKGSYLVNYRYSTLNILNKLGVIPMNSPTNFQDLSYNIFLPTKKAGTFTLFGFGGLSTQDARVKDDSTKWENDMDRFSSLYKSSTGISALTHFIKLGEKATLKSAISYSFSGSDLNVAHTYNLKDEEPWYMEKFSTGRLTLNTTLKYKASTRHTLYGGVYATQIYFNYLQKIKPNISTPIKQSINTTGNNTLLQAYAQWKYTLARNVYVHSGVHVMQLMLNKNSFNAEPRLSIKWDFTPKNSLAIAYGLHSQIQSLGVYFAEVENMAGHVETPNKNLGLSKSQHTVLSYSHFFTKNLRFKTELYYQRLFNIPVSIYDTSTFSTVNIQDGYIIDPLTNKGTGSNYGIEFSLEKYLSNNLYYMINTSAYEAKYKALDNIERNTLYNGRFVCNAVAGKDFVTSNQKRTFGINIKFLYRGGLWDSPIDIQSSAAAGTTKYVQKQAFTTKLPDYYRADIKVSVKWNRARRTNTLSLDLQNATNRENVYANFYDPLKQKVITIKQLGILPILNYKTEF